MCKIITTMYYSSVTPPNGEVLEEAYGTCVKINYRNTTPVIVNNIIVSGGDSYTSSIMVDLDNGERIMVSKFPVLLSLEELCQGDRVRLEYNVSKGKYILMEYGKDLDSSTR